ncbi:histidine phosphatase family protein [Ciceribacter sp. L1K23]|uniref:histidine phosphatase family protein n=1 Tax=Ciceribacter sp. L1K23 TaxID=2820276 RepID=UPI001B82749E|nr:histidine phosphatase family protein [Ciceribacter sp. L1K23]MBR0555499.1 histidine phosphatase family protein [Ciceribacter sp. L1K23]
MFLRRQFLAGSVLLLAGGARAAVDHWAELRSGRAVMLLRHALAPGTGDPPGFRIGACETQRNLSDEGRAQAGRIGDLFRDNGVSAAAVYSSQWCRCLDTAEGLALGDVTEQPLLNSFFGNREDGEAQTQALAAWMATLPTSGPVVLVTHQVNITGLTGIVPASGELLFVTPGAATPLPVIGRLTS